MTQPSPLILALDVPSRDEALAWVHRLHGHVGIFKVGMQLFYHCGPEIVKAIQETGAQVFLDLKLHDIPNTVAHACGSLLPLAPTFLTVHLSGGPAMLASAQQVVEGSPIRLLGITALTSLDAEALRAIYPDMTQSPSDWALHLATLAQQAGLYGVVCSAGENRGIRQALGEDLCLVNPGVRPAGSATQDQKRAYTPHDAISEGAHYLVIGRPILQAADPIEALIRIQEEVAHATGLPA